ncbi:unnamed protein product (macronuclear) [Paramecium tetraurelia]|uniref:Kinesin motor domain-containing protein n=1 Tax=Paramecium tetraurelia TaxID=5888 RepID=A0CCL3_PARTE|nr:uncharacterized protein GSPATT00037315001 [Paramecium tetraurelia]CAK68530.1 unnamed protein product [Paramecium tetraurelia]|eukprot:XP_001435927.1 hypothetical protein (macronuclear) [Paramecium tetraurelia strain d4-2]
MHNITVAIRVKPVQQTFKTIIVNGSTVTLLDPELEFNNPVDILKKNRIKDASYEFDLVFDQQADQKEVYEKSAEPLLDDLISGQNVTIFAYGATGSGKTHTMMGSQNQQGIIPRALNDLFVRLSKEQAAQASLTFLEIYNETIRDLLTGKLLDLREDGNKGLVVVNLFKAPVPTLNDINQYIKYGNSRRAKEPTGANENSTRSHTVLQLMLKQCTFTFVDLAGSERASQTTNKGQRMVEGAMINRSLLVLGNCIKALFSKEQFVPFRGSKLTRLLKDALQGNSKTVMIANVAPNNYEDSFNTLLYAHRTRNIDPTPNNFQEMIVQLREENEDIKKTLKKQNSQSKMQLQIEQQFKEQQRQEKMEKQQQQQQIQQIQQQSIQQQQAEKQAYDEEPNQINYFKAICIRIRVNQIIVQVRGCFDANSSRHYVQFQQKTEDLITKCTDSINNTENEQFEIAMKYKTILQQRRKIYDQCMQSQFQSVKDEFRKQVQNIEKMKGLQSEKREEVMKKFKELEIEHLKKISNQKNGNQPQIDEETLKEIKKNRLQSLNKQIKDGKL